MNPDAIPQELRGRGQWICWRYEQRDDKQTKVPYQPSGQKASTTNPRTWSTFETVLTAKDNFDGIGFVFNADSIGVDLDHAIDGVLVKPWAVEIIRACPTYVEISPSGTGLHLISRGSLPKNYSGRKRSYHDGAVEIYSRGRFFTVTGDHLETTPCTIEDQSASILELYTRIGGTNGNDGASRNGSRPHETFLGSTDERLAVALRDPVFSRLWYGDTSANNHDDSAADLALCNKLAFYFGPDPDVLDRLFRQSGLYRQKWERADYRQWTINKAIEGTTETYSPMRGTIEGDNGRSPGPDHSRNEPIIDSNEENSETEHAETEIRPTKYSDDALADLFSARHKDDFRYADSWRWLQWDGKRWLRVPDVVVMGHARQICRQQSDLCREDDDVSQKARKGLARALASAKTVAAVVRLAACDKRHYATVSQFDTDLWRFNTPGGTVDLRTGAIQHHRREDYITKMANAIPAGACPKWRDFLKKVTGEDEDVQKYLQRLAGYAMCGDPSEECLDFFHGQGANGKGTYLKTLQHLFGDYATTAAAETFLESKGERHPADIAKLCGARLVIAQEIDEGQYWNESRLKTMTGRDVMTARFMRENFFDFVPQFTIIIAGNNKPSLKSIDEAWRRRFHLVPWNVTIPVSEQNPNLKTELQTESDGIMNWCLAGCLTWQEQRLRPPEAVLAATADYFDSENTFAIWIMECCLTGHEGYEEPSASLYASYRRWKEARGERAAGTKTFSQRVSKEGFQLGQRTTGDRARMFVGIRLTDAERINIQMSESE
jgi:P4 family phage/plasmid primase-like protien